MPDLHVVAVLTAKPGSESVVHDALAGLVGPTQEEAGCQRYVLFESTSAPGTFVTIERWTDQTALDAHMASPHIAAALSATSDALAVPPAIHTLKRVAGGARKGGAAGDE